MTRIAVIGCGYVGGVSAACFAELGHEVDCVDINRDRIGSYRRGHSPIYEPGLDELLGRGLASGRLTFSDRYPDEFEAEIIFIAVNTPGSHEGAADLRAVRDAISCVAPKLRPGSIIVNKSTVPIGTGDLVQGMAERAGQRKISVVSNPEFLREGSAVRDFMNPDRIVLGSNDLEAVERVANLYAPLRAEVVRVDIRTAEMIKYASNAFLATKISFINEMASICEALGADVVDVARGMGMDVRIGAQFLSAGLGWGGSCFPKDVRALAHMASVHGTHPQLLLSVIEINSGQRIRTVAKVRNALGVMEGKTIVVLGAAFKASTDDIRNSPAIELANLLALDGAEVRITDPVVRADQVEAQATQAKFISDLDAAASGADAIVLATDWSQYREADYGRLAKLMRSPVMIDSRNALDPEAMRRAGFAYFSVGRPSQDTPLPSGQVRSPALATEGAL